MSRPTRSTYQPEFTEQAAKLCKLGATGRELAEAKHPLNVQRPLGPGASTPPGVWSEAPPDEPGSTGP